MSELEALRARVRELEDVNERLEATEASLRASGQIIRRILETVPSGVVHVASKGDIRLANATAQDILGLSFDELTDRYTVDFAGETLYEDGQLCPVEDYPVTRCLVTGAPQPPMTIGVRHRDGGVRWAIFTAMPVDLEDGRGAVVTFVDITERRAAEQEREALGERVSRAERLASLGTLAAGLAHEINNPLTFLLGNLEMVAMSLPEGSLMAESLADAQIGALRIARIVKDMGVFASRDSAEIAPFDVRRALQEAVRLSEPVHRGRAVIRLDVEGGCVAMGQEWRAVQVFVNLITNAALACPEGAVAAHAITVSAQRLDADVLIEVADDGRGMTTHQLSRAFQPFFSTRKQAGGTGLGLSISHGIITGMGGEIELESEVGEGTVARVRLPAGEAAAAAPQAGPSALASAEAPAPRAGLRVLVVDDEQAILKTTTLALKHHDVVAVGSGREALAVCEEQTFDAILLDLMMPDLTGADVVRALRERAPSQASRVVLMTGGAYTAALRMFVEEGGLPVLSKPFTVSALEEALSAASRAGG